MSIFSRTNNQWFDLWFNLWAHLHHTRSPKPLMVPHIFVPAPLAPVAPGCRAPHWKKHREDAQQRGQQRCWEQFCEAGALLWKQRSKEVTTGFLMLEMIIASCVGNHVKSNSAREYYTIFDISFCLSVFPLMHNYSPLQSFTKPSPTASLTKA